MLAYDPTNFMHSLIRFVAAATSLPYHTGSPRALWRGQVHEAVGVAAADPFTVIRDYGGAGTHWEALPAMSVQVETIGSSIDAVRTRAHLVFGALLDAAKRPVHMLTIDAYLASGAGTTADGTYRLVGVELLQRPGFVGLDAKGRQRVVFNFDVAFTKLT